MKAVVGCDGKIKDLTLIGGPPLLVNAAIAAVRQWIYRPTLLNGLPVEVDTEIYVQFALI
jgi:protein TonB